MSQLIAWKKEREELMTKADNIVASAELTKRKLTSTEIFDFNQSMDAVTTLNEKIKGVEKTATLRTQFPAGVVLTDGARGGQKAPAGIQLSEDYRAAFQDYISSAGKKMDAALYEGSNPAGGFAVPVVVDGQIVPLAPQEMAIRRISTVLPTASDIKFPTKAAFGTAAIKTELSTFGGTAPSLGQFTLSAFMIGAQNDLSWELVQDVPVVQQFVIEDMILSQQMLEESYYVTGTGSGQPQGLIGNVSVGGTYEADTAGNLVTIAGTLELTGTLNAAYHPNASWVMQRATAIIIRAAQVAANLFNPAWTRVGTQDYLHGYPVEYVTDMPAATRGNTPVLFGDFKKAYLIGDRGGSGINVKVLDQPKANQGILTLLTYRRTDGRVRLPEAVKSYTIAAS
jgi:HK97 family phage major capsid protein